MTTITDYGTLQTAIAERLGDSTLTSLIPGWIDLCRQRISRDIRAFFDETDVEITIDAQTVALPTGYVEQRRHYINIASTSTGGIQRVEYMSPERLWDFDLLKQPQLPTFYTIEGRNLVFSPAPDTEYTGQWLIWQNPTAFVNDTDTNTLLQEHSGVYLYGSLIEATMQQVVERRKPSFVSDKIASLALKQLLPNQGLLSMVVGGMRLYQRLGVQKLLRRSGLLKLLPGNMGELEESLPELPSEVFRVRGQVYPAQGQRRARVALLSGCVMPLVNGPQMNAVVRVLTRNGCDVVVTRAQVCCGAINSHVGDLETARQLARRNVDAFLAEDVDYVVVASAGCGSRMKEYGHLLRNDPEYSDKGEAMSAKVRDIHELLADLPIVPPKGHLPYRVTYQDSCHLSNAQRVTEAPRQLLRSIPGIEFVELSNADKCCGAGGTYTITERDFSMRILDTKMRAVRQTQANVIATANPGCLMQLQYGAQREGMPLEVRYITDLLDESYSKESNGA